jgi:Tol biopolymer transport system component
MNRKHFIGFFIALFLGGLLACGNADVENKRIEDYKRNHPSAKQVNAFIRDISPDNKTLLFQYGSPYWSKIAIYNMLTGDVHILSDDKNKMYCTPYYSRDGKKIAFIGFKESGYAANIYIMNADGSGTRKVTKNPEVKNGGVINAAFPSFSPDGKRIIFLRSHGKRERALPLRGEMDSAWDIYELDIAIGAEKRLTNYNFYKALWPYYLTDGKRFIFTGEGPYNPRGPGPKDFQEYERKYQKNFILIMDGGNNDLKPAFVNGRHSHCPSVANDDTVLFISRTDELDGQKGQEMQDLFLYKKGKIKRLTEFNAYITWAQISRDGSTIVFSKKRDRRSQDHSDCIMKSDGSGLREIRIPVDKLKR